MHQEVNLLYEDGQIIVCEKPAGIPTQSRDVREKDIVSILKNHLRQEASTAGARTAQGRTSAAGEIYLSPIHRLDQPVRGIIVFAKTPQAAKALNRQLTDHRFQKEYLALTEGTPPEEEGVLEDYLVTDHRTNTTRVCQKDTPGAKFARLKYQVQKENQETTKLHIELETGRHHQIRVQLANIGCPIIGDTKYGHTSEKDSDIEGLCLCAYRLSFCHPSTQECMSFQIEPDF